MPPIGTLSAMLGARCIISGASGWHPAWPIALGIDLLGDGSNPLAGSEAPWPSEAHRLDGRRLSPPSAPPLLPPLALIDGSFSRP